MVTPQGDPTTPIEGARTEARDLRPSYSTNTVDSRNKTQAYIAQSGSQGSMRRTGSAPSFSRLEEDMPNIVVGICAMDKKARSKQMNAIVERLLRFGQFEVVIFGDDTILNSPVEDWPVCQCLLSWHSEGFPLKKAQDYVTLRRPYLVNDLFAQDTLLDRRQVYKKLTASGIPVPTHIIVDREDLSQGQTDPEGFVETEDFVEFGGVRIQKPFVEKPACAEDHNVYIYYPHSMGGGVKRLFRKVDNRSADYDPDHPGTVRRDGSYIYEEFLTTGGTDVKVYTVGPRYAHAEARKSPVVDGKVLRSPDGKEIRFPVLLSPQEKEIARMVCLAFGQRVCGFDLLRSERGRSYVCDVNGWSFVKNSHKYYDDAAGILRMIILSAVAPHRLLAAPQPSAAAAEAATAHPAGMPAGGSAQSSEMKYAMSYDDFRAPVSGADDADVRHEGEELRCVLAVIRHGDRTPKQKMKMRVTQPALLGLLTKYMDSKGKQAKLKSPNELHELLDVTRQLLDELEQRKAAAEAAAAAAGEGGAKEGQGEGQQGLSVDPEADELREKFRIVKTVLEQGGQFAGINRKVQLKPLAWTSPPEGCSEVPRCTEALLILKHGGVLTHSGREQAEALGSLFRNIMYPQTGPENGGLLRLHSTYRHDLKIYTSDEGRVQSSAAAFTKGLLDLEGAALTPILVSLVTKDAGLLDAFGKGASVDINHAKQELYAQMTWDQNTATSMFQKPQITAPLVSPPPSPSPRAAAADPASGAHPFSSFGAPSSRAATPLGHSAGVTRATSAGSTGSESASLAAALAAAGSTLRKISSLDSAMARHAVSLGDPGTFAPEGDDFEEGASNVPGRPHIFPMPPNPLQLLHRLYQLLKLVVDQLRQKCVEEPRSEERPRSYSALTQDPKEWALDPNGKPCGGEKLLLMFDRWRKLLKAFYSEKKGQFDISKVPDIYDAAKYDAIHNTHVGLTHMHDVYDTSKTLAAAVIANEYGIQPSGKLRIGSMVCSTLLGKLLADLASMREESVATAGLQHSDDLPRMDSLAEQASPFALTSLPPPPSGPSTSAGMAGSISPAILGGAAADEEQHAQGQLPPGAAPAAAAAEDQQEESEGGEEGVVGGEDDDDDGSDAVLHRLCPTYAQDVNSPLRHVRTRIYFTSESHCHAVMNVLRYCQLGLPPNAAGAPPAGLVSAAGHRLLRDCGELDYMTHFVLRMFENKRLALDDPARFRVEILFSPGAAHDPFSVCLPKGKEHVLPIIPRTAIHDGDNHGSGVPLQRMEAMLKPYAKPFKRVAEPYNLRGVTINSQASEIDFLM